MKKFLIGIFSFVALFVFLVPSVFAQTTDQPSDKYYKGKVIQLIEEGKNELGNDFQKVRIRFLDGELKDKEAIFDHGGQFTIREEQKVKLDDIVVIDVTSSEDDGFVYQIVDKYRLDALWAMFSLFFVSVVILSGWKGIGSFLGLGASLLVIIVFIIPQILAGRDPLLVSILGSIVIMITSIYLAHGFTKQTTIAVVSTFLTLIIAGVLSVLFVNLTKLSGLGSEDAAGLQFGQTSTINFKGLLLGGMIIGFLGVLDDITTGIAATVFEIKKQNSKISFASLIKSSLNVGREHISSLVNTLVLAYAGASLPIFLFLVLNPLKIPLWALVNSEMISEEIVRTLAGSMGLLLAVPITTLLASYWVNNKSKF